MSKRLNLSKISLKHIFVTLGIILILALTSLMAFLFLWIKTALSTKPYAGEIVGMEKKVLLERKISYDHFDQIQSEGGFKSQILLSPDNKNLLFHDNQILPNRTYVINLETGRETLLFTGPVEKAKWVNNSTVSLIKWPRTAADTEIVEYDSKLRTKTEKTFPTTEKISEGYSDFRTGCIQKSCPPEKDQDKHYTADKNYYYLKNIKTECFLNCSDFLISIKFFTKEDQEIGEYVFPQHQKLNNVFFVDNWTQDDKFLIFEREQTRYKNKIEDRLDEKARSYYVTQENGKEIKIEAPIEQNWRIFTLSVPSQK